MAVTTPPGDPDPAAPHPESAAGPNDTLDLFDRFVRMLTEHRDAAAPAATEGA